MLQRYSNGKWRTMDDTWFNADYRLYVSGEELTGARLRVRSGYVWGSSWDQWNASTWSSYRYFTFI